MRQTTILLIMCLALLNVNAQKIELLKGKWKYKDIADKEKLDSTILKQAKLLFSKMEMEFSQDGKYSCNPLGDNPHSIFNGTWTLNNEQTKVSVTMSKPSSPENKKTSEWEIKGLTAKELKLNMGKVVIVFCRPPLPTPNIPKKEEEKKNVEKPIIASANATINKPAVSQPVTIPDPTIFVKKVNDYIVFKEGAGFGLKDNNNTIVFPAVLALIDSGPMKDSFQVAIDGYYIEEAYFGGGGFMGDMVCDVCHGSGFVDKDYHLSKETKKTVHKSYLGGGVWEEVTVTTVTPPKTIRVDAQCSRCRGLGKLRGGINYSEGKVKVWNWQEELEKSRN